MRSRTISLMIRGKRLPGVEINRSESAWAVYLQHICEHAKRDKIS